MRIKFSLDNFTIFQFGLSNYEKVEDLKVNDKIGMIDVLRNKEAATSLTPSILKEALKFYLGGTGTLKEYIDHIKQNGFCSPYQINLNVTIED